jgi:hypothetical protein
MSKVKRYIVNFDAEHEYSIVAVSNVTASDVEIPEPNGLAIVMAINDNNPNSNWFYDIELDTDKNASADTAKGKLVERLKELNGGKEAKTEEMEEMVDIQDFFNKIRMKEKQI